jgi:hypothetical protein
MSSTITNHSLGVEIEITDNSDEVRAAFENAIERALWSIGEAAEGHAKNTILDAGRVRYGLMLNSITHQEGEDFTAIGTDVKYAKWHEIGTGIYATDGDGKKSPWRYKDDKGNWHYTRGIKPIHFLQKAATEHNDQYKGIVKDSLENA